LAEVDAMAVEEFEGWVAYFRAKAKAKP